MMQVPYNLNFYLNALVLSTHDCLTFITAMRKIQAYCNYRTDEMLQILFTIFIYNLGQFCCLC